MPITATVKKYKDEDVIVLKSDCYEATIAPFIGSNVMRMRNNEMDVEFFRYDEARAVGVTGQEADDCGQQPSRHVRPPRGARRR